MSPDASLTGWKRLGELLTLRRVELDLRYQNRTIFSTERGLDYRLVYDIEEHRRPNFRTTTLAGIAAAYAVTFDSLLAVLRDPGANLEPLPPAGAPHIAVVPDPPLPGAELSALDKIAALIASATPAEREKLDAMVGAMVQNNEVLRLLHGYPDPKGPVGKRLDLKTRLALCARGLPTTLAGSSMTRTATVTRARDSVADEHPRARERRGRDSLA